MTDQEIYELVNTSNEWADKPFVTPKEIAEVFDVTRQAAYFRLEQLVDQGEVEKYIPSRSAIYWTEPCDSEADTD